MKRWVSKPLGDLLEISRERVEPFDHPATLFNYVALESVEGHTGNLLPYQPTLGAEIKSTKNIFHDGEILYGKLRPYLNKVHLAKQDGICSTDIYVLRPRQRQVNAAFAANYLRSPSVLSVVSSAMAGANLPRISQEALLGIPMPVPPLAEQERIVKLLDEADELRKLRVQANRRAARLIPAIFNEMFGDVERNEAKWPTKVVGELCTLVRGSSPRPRSDPRYYGGPIPRLMIEDITRDGWSVTPRVDSLTELGATMSRPVKAGTVVMAVSGNIGLCAQLSVDACVHDGFVAFKELQEDVVVPLYFGMALGQMRQSHRRNQAGAIFQNITTTDVKAMEVPVPSLALQQEFVQRVAEIRELEAGQTASREQLEALFQSTLHRAFEGEL